MDEVWVVLTTLHNEMDYETVFEGGTEKKESWGNVTRTKAVQRAEEYAKKVCTEGLYVGGETVRTYYPANMIREIMVYKVEVDDSEESVV